VENPVYHRLRPRKWSGWEVGSAGDEHLTHEPAERVTHFFFKGSRNFRGLYLTVFVYFSKKKRFGDGPAEGWLSLSFRVGKSIRLFQMEIN